MIPADRGREADYPLPRTAWAIVLTLAIANVFSFLDRQILGLLVDPIKKSMAISDTQVSLLIGPAFAIFYGAMGIPLGWAADRFRRLNVTAGGIALWSLMTCLGGFASSFPMLFIARIGVGVGEASLLPAANSIIADCFPPEKRTQPTGFLMTAVYIGSGLALTCGGLLIGLVESDHVHIPGFAGRPTWQVVLILIGTPGLLLSAVTAILPEPRRQDIVIGSPTDGSLTLFGYFRQRATALICHFLAYSALVQIGYCLLAWAPSVLIREHGWTASASGLWLGMVGMIAGVTAILISTRVADHLLARGITNAFFLIGVGTAAIGIGATLLMSLSGNPGSFLLSYGLLIAVSAAGIGSNGAALLQITPNQFRGRTIGAFLISSSLIGAGLGPPAVAILSTNAPHEPAPLSHALMVTSLAALLVAIISFTLGLTPFSKAAHQLARESKQRRYEDGAS